MYNTWCASQNLHHHPQILVMETQSFLWLDCSEYVLAAPELLQLGKVESHRVLLLGHCANVRKLPLQDVVKDGQFPFEVAVTHRPEAVDAVSCKHSCTE